MPLLEDVPPGRCALSSLVPRAGGSSRSYMFLCVCVLPLSSPLCPDSSLQWALLLRPVITY